nr:hypothetical protein [Campylobacter jejuni]
MLKDNKGISRKRYALDEQGNKITDNSYLRGYKEIEVTFADILNIQLNGQEVLINQTTSNEFLSSISNKLDDTFNFDALDGDFSQLQAKQFFSRYDLLKHCPNTNSGFSATLFGEKRKQIDSKTKEEGYTSEYGYINYILAIRGTEMDLFVADASLTIGSIPKAQYDDMLNFYETCIKIIHKSKKKILLLLQDTLLEAV